MSEALNQTPIIIPGSKPEAIVHLKLPGRISPAPPNMIRTRHLVHFERTLINVSRFACRAPRIIQIVSQLRFSSGFLIAFSGCGVAQRQLTSLSVNTQNAKCVLTMDKHRSKERTFCIRCSCFVLFSVIAEDVPRRSDHHHMIIERLSPSSVSSPRPTHGLFFAIMAPPEVSGKISDTFRTFRNQYPFRKGMIAGNRLHMSLVPMFAGDRLPDDIIRTSTTIGSAIRFLEFNVVFDTALSFRNRREERPFVIVADRETSQTVNSLVHQIQNICCILSGSRGSRNRSITPHITVAWDRLSVPARAIEPIVLPAEEIALVHSHIGKSRYDILASWPLVPRR